MSEVAEPKVDTEEISVIISEHLTSLEEETKSLLVDDKKEIVEEKEI